MWFGKMIMLLGKSFYIASSGEGIPQSGDQSQTSFLVFILFFSGCAEFY